MRRRYGHNIISPLKIALMKIEGRRHEAFQRVDNSGLIPQLVATKVGHRPGKGRCKRRADQAAALRRNLLPQRRKYVEFLKTVPILISADMPSIGHTCIITECAIDLSTEYRRIRPIINEIGTRPLIALTATATRKYSTTLKGNPWPWSMQGCSSRRSTARIFTAKYAPRQPM